MKPIDVAIDDYMHAIARTRPWTIKREAELLEAFSEWLYAQPPAPVMLDDIAIEHMQQYAMAAALSASTRDELRDVLSNVYLWSAKQGWIEHNPFRMVAS